MAALGQKLREERESRNISIEEIAAATKIVPRYLEALEADHLDQMPGGFFVKGIIRSYARAIGLDADEVLSWYKAAGLVGGTAESVRAAAPRPAPAEKVPPYVPTVPAEPESPREAAPAPAPVHEAVTDLFVEEAPKPGLSPAARKRLFAWGWRTLAVLIVITAVFYLWSSRRPRPPQPAPGTFAAREALPPAQKTEPVPAPVPQSQTENAVRSRRQAPRSENRAPARRGGGLEGRHDRDLVPGRDLDPGPHRRRDQGQRRLPRRGHGPGPGGQGAAHPHRQRRRLPLPPERPAGQAPRPVRAGPDGHQDPAGQSRRVPRRPGVRPVGEVTLGPMLPSA